MLGFSVFLGEDLSDVTIEYLKRMKAAGCHGIFTSLHIPEDDSSKYLQRVKVLGKLAKEHQLHLMVDISAKALEAIGVDINDDLSTLKELGITGIRMDYGISMETIAAVSRKMTVGLNASTLTEAEVKELEDYKGNFANMELWHNYYPRKETGLSKASFIERNRWLKSKGLKVIAFIPGDGQLRGPLFEHLPTLEEHRYQHPLSAALDLVSDCQVDEVYVGDGSICEKTIQQCESYFNQHILKLEVAPLTTKHHHLFIGRHTNRVDDARDVVRSQEARFKEIPLIAQENGIIRSFGSITLDNHLYGRYTGELQLTKKDLPADSRVNVVAKIVSKDLNLVPWIKPGAIFELYLGGS